MASIAPRVIARTSAYSSDIIRFSGSRQSHISRPSGSQHHTSLLSWPRSNSRIPTVYSLEQRSSLSTSGILSRNHSSVNTIRRTTQQHVWLPRLLQGFNRSIFQRRSVSQQSNQDPKEPQSTSSTPITAPTILKQALNPAKHENIYTLPNFLTFSRLLSAPAIGYFILNSQPVIALSLFFYAGLTDLVDGYLARRYNSATVVGTILDPMADKTLMTVAVVCLGVQGVIPIWLAVIILGRDVGLAISATYYRYISLPPPKTFTRYWDFSLPSAEVRPTEISKINTLLQLLLVGNALVLPVLPVAWVQAWNLVGVFEGWQFLVAGTTVWSGLSYVFSNDAVKILSQEEKKVEDKGRKV